MLAGSLPHPSRGTLSPVVGGGGPPSPPGVPHSETAADGFQSVASFVLYCLDYFFVVATPAWESVVHRFSQFSL